MRVATWNINGLRSRFDFLLHWLRSRRPDIVGLQEIKLTDAQFPRTELEAEGYCAAVYGQKAWNGVAVLSRSESVVVQRGLPGAEDLGARLLTAEVDGLAFTTVYCPNGKSLTHQDFQRKLAWFDTLRAHLAETHRDDRPAIVGGDFNVCPAPIDSWHADGGGIFHTEEERSRFRALLDCGFEDAFSHLEPETRAFSWWDYRGGAFHQKQGLRIDFLLANPAALARLRSVEIDREYRKKKDGLTPSDHAPVIADLAD